MTKEHEILKKFADVAALAGIRGEISHDCNLFAAHMDIGAGRTQVIYVRPLPEAAKGQDVVCVYSPCRRIKKGMLKGISKEECLDLLRLNSDLLFARYGILESEDEFVVVASVDAMLDTMDPEEVEAAFVCVGIGADNYERAFGGDEF